MLKTLKNIINSQLYSISLYSRQISSTLVLFLIARYISVYDYGIFSSYKNIALFCLMFANLGFADYILVSSRANVNEVKLKISLFLLNAIFICIFFSGCSLFCPLDKHLLFILIIARTFFDTTFFSLILPYFQAVKKFNVIATINFVYSILISFIAIISFIFKLSLTKFVLLNVILGVINFIQCSYYAKINYFPVIKHFKRFLKKLDKSIFAYICVTFASLIYTQINSLYISTTQKKEDAALYFAAYTIATIIQLLITAQAQKMIPEMINNTIVTVKKIIKNNMFFILGITFTVFIFMVFAGKILLQLLYGQKYYTNAYGILLILMLGNICAAEGGVYGTYITASGNQKKKIPMLLEASFVAIISLLILYKLGIYGAAISYLVAALYAAIRFTIFAKKLLKLAEL